MPDDTTHPWGRPPERGRPHQNPGRSTTAVVLSISAAVLLGIIVVVLIKGGYVRVGSVLVCTLFGFTLAATGLAPAINNGLTALVGLISSL